MSSISSRGTTLIRSRPCGSPSDIGPFYGSGEVHLPARFSFFRNHVWSSPVAPSRSVIAYRAGIPAAPNPCAAVLGPVLAPTSQVGLLRMFDRFGLLSAQAALSSAIRLVGGVQLAAVRQLRPHVPHRLPDPRAEPVLLPVPGQRLRDEHHHRLAPDDHVYACTR